MSHPLIFSGVTFAWPDGTVVLDHTDAVFSTGRAYDQIRSSVAIPRLNVKICGSSAGLSPDHFELP